MQNSQTSSDLKSRWLPYLEVQLFFNYKPTQMAMLLKDEALKVAKVGKRKFICRESLDKFLDERSKK